MLIVFIRYYWQAHKGLVVKLEVPAYRKDGSWSFNYHLNANGKRDVITFKATVVDRTRTHREIIANPIPGGPPTVVDQRDRIFVEWFDVAQGGPDLSTMKLPTKFDVTSWERCNPTCVNQDLFAHLKQRMRKKTFRILSRIHPGDPIPAKDENEHKVAIVYCSTKGKWAPAVWWFNPWDPIVVKSLNIRKKRLLKHRMRVHKEIREERKLDREEKRKIKAAELQKIHEEMEKERKMDRYERRAKLKKKIIF